MSYLEQMIVDSNTAEQHLSLENGWLKLRGFDTFPVDALTDDMRGAEVLDFSNNSFSSLPDELGDIFTHARVIFLSGTQLRTLPAGLASLTRLEMVGARSSGLERINVNALPPSLRVLTLTDNEITEIPSEIGTLKFLEKLCISGNLLTNLPSQLTECRNLEMLRVASNRIRQEPAFLGDLPELKWYNDAGNEYSVIPESVEIPEIAHTRIRLVEVIGKSANNQVYRALLDDIEEVAVKVYGSELSTDGTVRDEIVAMSVAGSVSGVIGARGVTIVDEKPAVIMPLVRGAYSQLASPPDLRNYTRDRYDATRAFTAHEAEVLVTRVREAVQALHKKGVTHGDIYGHNLLYRAEGDVLVNDFGAASLFSSEGTVRRAIDMRAVDLLEQEIYARVSYLFCAQATRRAHRYLHRACLLQGRLA